MVQTIPPSAVAIAVAAIRHLNEAMLHSSDGLLDPTCGLLYGEATSVLGIGKFEGKKWIGEWSRGTSLLLQLDAIMRGHH